MVLEKKVWIDILERTIPWLLGFNGASQELQEQIDKDKLNEANSTL
jgi:hypothetical protein